MNRKSVKRKSKLNMLHIWIAIMSLFIAELLVYTWCRVQFVGIGYEISAGAHRQEELKNLHNSLKVELAVLKSPARIADIAKNQLGLVTPTPQQTIVMP